MSSPNSHATNSLASLDYIEAEVDATENIQEKSRISFGLEFGFVTFLRLAIGRSLFPITAVIIIGGVVLWGPWISLILAFSWFAIVLAWLG